MCISELSAATAQLISSVRDAVGSGTEELILDFPFSAVLRFVKENLDRNKKNIRGSYQIPAAVDQLGL